MAKSKDKAVEEMIEVVEEVAEPAPPVPSAKKPLVLVRAPASKVYNLEQWAKLRGKPDRHLRGMRAFLGVEAGHRFTLEMWDSKMKAY